MHSTGNVVVAAQRSASSLSEKESSEKTHASLSGGLLKDKLNHQLMTFSSIMWFGPVYSYNWEFLLMRCAIVCHASKCQKQKMFAVDSAMWLRHWCQSNRRFEMFAFFIWHYFFCCVSLGPIEKMAAHIFTLRQSYGMTWMQLKLSWNAKLADAALGKHIKKGPYTLGERAAGKKTAWQIFVNIVIIKDISIES